jgi:hypothetical protein
MPAETVIQIKKPMMAGDRSMLVTSTERKTPDY